MKKLVKCPECGRVIDESDYFEMVQMCVRCYEKHPELHPRDEDSLDENISRLTGKAEK